MKEITKIKIDNLIKEGWGYVTDSKNQALIIGNLQETIICLYEEIQLLEQKLKNEVIKEAQEKGDIETNLDIRMKFLIDDVLSSKNNIKIIQSNQKNFAMVLEQHEKSIQEIKRKLKAYEPKKDI